MLTISNKYQAMRKKVLILVFLKGLTAIFTIFMYKTIVYLITRDTQDIVNHRLHYCVRFDKLSGVYKLQNVPNPRKKTRNMFFICRLQRK